jgi:phosphohistidine phosphatase
MELYLVQHGDAFREQEDPERRLTAQGEETVRRVAAAAVRIGLSPSEIRHSGKRRAAQTAEILARALGRGDRIVAAPGMAPNDDVHPVAEALRNLAEPLMLVGHLPFLSRLASLLLIGDPERSLIRFANGGIVCLDQDDASGGEAATWSVAWYLHPRLAVPQSP